LGAVRARIAAAGRNAATRQAFREALDRSENALAIAAAFARYLVGSGSTKEAEQLADDLSVPDGSTICLAFVAGIHPGYLLPSHAFPQAQ
jgi:hypothetical protein